MARVIKSDVPAVIIGHEQIEVLTARKNESLEFRVDQEKDEAKLRQRLEDVLDAARLDGMSAEGIAEGRQMILDEFKNIWRITLGPDDYADVPPMEMEMNDPNQRLSKPYSKR